MKHSKLGIGMCDYVIYEKDIRHYECSAQKLSNYEASLIEELDEHVDFCYGNEISMDIPFPLLIWTKE